MLANLRVGINERLIGHECVEHVGLLVEQSHPHAGLVAAHGAFAVAFALESHAKHADVVDDPARDGRRLPFGRLCCRAGCGHDHEHARQRPDPAPPSHRPSSANMSPAPEEPASPVRYSVNQRHAGVLGKPASNALPSGGAQSRGPTTRPRTRPCRSIRTAVGVAITLYRLVTSPSGSRTIGMVIFLSLIQLATVDRLSWMLTAMTLRPRSDRS